MAHRLPGQAAVLCVKRYLRGEIMAVSVLDNEDADRRVWLETGIPGLDTILSGGLLQGGLYLVEGHAGTGKTILGFQCGLNYARRRDRVVVVTLLSESHGRLIDHLRGFDFFDGAVIARSFLLLSGYGAAKEGLAALRQLLAHTLMQEKPRLLVIDGFSGIRSFASGEQSYADFLLELSALVAAAGCTALLLSTVGGRIQEVQQALVDGIIELSTTPFGVRRIRELEVHNSVHHGASASEIALAIIPNSIARHIACPKRSPSQVRSASGSTSSSWMRRMRGCCATGRRSRSHPLPSACCAHWRATQTLC